MGLSRHTRCLLVCHRDGRLTWSRNLSSRIYSECKYLHKVYTTHEVAIDLNRSNISRFESNHLPSNSPTEDRRFLGTIPSHSRTTSGGGGIIQKEGRVCFGVVDGHAGHKCAQAVSGRLLDYLSASTLAQCSNEANGDWESHRTRWDLPGDYQESSLIRDRHRQSLRSWVTSSSENKPSSATSDDGGLDERIFSSAFEALDHHLIEDAMGVISSSMNRYDVDVIESALSGACVLTVAVDDEEVVCANSGDCKAVLGQLSEDGHSWHAIPLTNEHNAENSTEIQRIFDAHPESEHPTIIQGGRLFGSLLPLRAFGDMLFKLDGSKLNKLKQVFDVRNFLAKSITPPYLSASPEITRRQIDPKRDKFLIVGTDGLWDFVTSQVAVEVIGQHLDSANDPKPQFGSTVEEQHHQTVHRLSANGATRLMCHAVGQCMNSKTLPLFGQLNDMIKIAPEETRNNRDDIEVIVVYFR